MSDLKQKINDLILIAKNDRKVKVIGIALVVVTILVLLSQNSTPQHSVVRGDQTANRAVAKDNEAANDLVTAFEHQIRSVEQQNKQLQAQNELLQRTVEENINKTSGILEIITDKLELTQRKVDQVESNQQKVVTPEAKSTSEFPDAVENGLEGFGEVTESNNIPLPPPAPPKPVKMKFISPGDSVCVKLLTGVHAPVDGTPYPSVFKMTCPIEGPDGTSLDIGEARLIAAATGSEIDGRVVFRLTNLALRHPDGRRTVVKVDGWVVGEDGIRGLQGKLIDKLGKTIAAVASVSFLAALGDSTYERASNFDIEGDSLEVTTGDVNIATASALQNASNLLGKVLVDRYEKLVPVVEVLSGRDVAAVFSQPAELSVCEEDCDSEALLANYSLD